MTNPEQKISDIIQKSDCNIEVRIKSSYDCETFDFHFDEINYHLYLFDKILFKVPQVLGEWLFRHGFAVQNYIGMRKINNDNG
jgi:hypothetical protein